MNPPLTDTEFGGEGNDATRLQASAERLLVLTERLEKFSTRAHSSLAGDDLVASFDVLSFQVRGLLSTATDNLRGLTLIVIDADALPVFAGYTLLRNALECVGTSLWLLGPRSRDERVLRSLQLSFEAKRDDRILASALDGTPYVALQPGDETYDALVTLRERRPHLTDRSLRPPTVTSRLTSAEASVVPPSPRLALVAYWKLTSGIAHGRRDTIWRITRARIESETSLGAATIMSADVSLLAEILEAALSYLQMVMDLLDVRNISAWPTSQS